MFQEAPIDLKSRTPEKDPIRTVAELADFACDHNPHHVYCYQVEKVSGNSAGELNLRRVEFQHLKRGVLGCIDVLKSQLEVQNHGQQHPRQPNGVESSEKQPPPVGLFMESDLALPIHLVALVAMGVPVLLISARVSVESLRNIVIQSKAATLVVSPRLLQTAQQLVELCGSKNSPCIITSRPYAELLETPEPSKPTSIYEPNHYHSEEDQNVILIPSSSTTGIPKINYNSHRYLLAYAGGHEFRDRIEAEGLNVCTLPLFHAYGLMPIFMSMQVGETFCIPVCPDPPNGLQTLRLLQLSSAKSLMTVPSILEEIDELDDDSSTEVLSALNFVVCGGGPLKISLGERLASKGVPLVNMYGTSEVGAIATTFAPQSGYDWRYIKIRQDMDIALVPMETIGGSSPTYQRARMQVKVFGQSQPFEPSDEFICRPEKPDRHVRPVGRIDDVLVLGNGEKLSPQSLENALTDVTEVRAAVVCGNGRFELIALIELSHPCFNSVSTKDKIWEAVRMTNENSDAHARIVSPDAICILHPNKTLPRSDKGSVARASAYLHFSKDIELTYEKLENPKIVMHATDHNTPEDYSAIEIERKVISLVCNILNLQTGEHSFNINEDFFELGMDSLRATQLGRALQDIYAHNITSSLPRNFVYQHSTVAQICSYLQEPSKLDVKANGYQQFKDGLAMPYINQASFKFGSMFLQTNVGATVLLIGSRGNIGSNILRRLLQKSEVSTVICMDRHKSGAVMHNSHEPWQQNPITVSTSETDRVEHLTVDFSMPLFGLSLTQYCGLIHRVTHIVQNAWLTDLKRSFKSFGRHIKTTDNLLRLALDAQERRANVRPHFQFISSIATVARYYEFSGARMIPEMMFDFETTADFGYATAKYTSERLLEVAKTQRPDSLQVSIVRLGQVTGAHDGTAWNMKEFIPTLWTTSRDLGCFPRIQGTFSWLAADDAAAILVDLAFSPPPDRLVYHVENPVRQSWADIVDRVAGASGTAKGSIVGIFP